jgi:hypothetical protein
MALIDFVVIAVSFACALIGAGLVMVLIWLAYMVMKHD